MKAADIMTTPVISVGPETPVSEIASLLAERRISGVPVLDDGQLVGLVSEGDFLHRHEIGTDQIPPPKHWWGTLFGGRHLMADYIKSHASRARDIMTRDVLSVQAGAPIHEVALALEKRGIKRLPVLEGTRLVGIISRADLVRAIVAALPSGESAEPLSDDAIHARLLQELEHQLWWYLGVSDLSVEHGVVTYSGTVQSEEERDAARVAAESIPGVVGVKDKRLPMMDGQWMI